MMRLLFLFFSFSLRVFPQSGYVIQDYCNKSHDEISLGELPIYFDSITCGKILRVNEQRQSLGEMKVLGLMDCPVKYIGGLSGQNAIKLQEKIKKVKGEALSIDHGTAVASLISAKPCKLPCVTKEGM